MTDAASDQTPETMEFLGRRIKALIKSSEDKLVSAARCATEARQRFDSGETDGCKSWAEWWKQRTGLTARRAQQLLKIGRSPDPATAAEGSKTKNREAVAKHRAARQQEQEQEQEQEQQEEENELRNSPETYEHEDEDETGEADQDEAEQDEAEPWVPGLHSPKDNLVHDIMALFRGRELSATVRILALEEALAHLRAEAEPQNVAA